jgi:hypothetical protein
MDGMCLKTWWMMVVDSVVCVYIYTHKCYSSPMAMFTHLKMADQNVSHL